MIRNAVVGIGFIILLAIAWLYIRLELGERRKTRTKLHGDLIGLKKKTEVKYEAHKPYQISCRVDEVFLDGSNQVLLGEIKTRARLKVYPSDVLQLSICKLAVEAASTKGVSDSGYFRVITPEGNLYIKQQLLDERKVLGHINRYLALRSQKTVGLKCKSKALCRTCGYKLQCDDMD